MTIFSTLGIIQPQNTVLKQQNLISFLNQIISILYTLSGLFVLINLILAGYQYLSSNGDPQLITNAGNKILYSVYGLIFIAGSFVIAAALGQVLFNDPQALIKPTFFQVN